MILHPVILSVPQENRLLKGRARKVALSQIAREALQKSADLSDKNLGVLEKDDEQRPLPSNGNYWSLSHKPTYACAVVANFAVGIDVEQIRRHQSALFDRIATAKEWQLFRERNDEVFTRMWSAKEAVLKATGIGTPGLRDCRLTAIEEGSRLQLTFQGHNWLVDQLFLNGHIFSVTHEGQKILWHKPSS